MDLPGTPVALHEQGDALWQYGRTEEAEKAYAEAAARLEKLAATFPDSAALQQEMIRNLLSRALLLEHAGRSQEAEPLRARAHEIYRNLSPNDQQTLMWGFCERGRKLVATQNKRQAERTFSQAIELAPTNERARSRRSYLCASLGEWDKVVADCSQLIELNGDDADCWNRRGVAHSRLGQKEKALADYTKASELNPKVVLYWKNRASSCSQLGRYEQAVADYSKAIELKPDDPDCWNLRGVAHARLGQDDKALADYTKAVELQPANAVFWSNRGGAHFRTRQPDRAVADFSKAIEREPGQANYWNQRGYIYFSLSQWDKAAADYSKAIELKPEHATFWGNRGGRPCQGEAVRQGRRRLLQSHRAEARDPPLLEQPGRYLRQAQTMGQGRR